MSRKGTDTKRKKGGRADTRRESAGVLLLRQIAEASTAIYVFFILCIYPLYYHDNYSDMGVSKYAFFSRVTVGLLGIVTLAVAGLGLDRLIAVLRAGKSAAGRNGAYREAAGGDGKHERKGQKRGTAEKSEVKRLKRPGSEKSGILQRIGGLSVCDLFVIAYLILSILSYLFSSFRAVPTGTEGVTYDLALFGFNGWSMGLLSQIMFFFIYFYVSRFWKWSPFTLIAAVVAAALAYQIGILQRFGFNPLGMYDNLGPEDIEKFLSTLGQSSWYTSYAILIVPFGLYFYFEAESLRTRLLSAFFVALSFGMIGTANSDSAYFALVLIFMVFFCYSLKDNDAFCRFLECAMTGVGSFLCIGLLRSAFPKRSVMLITGEERITNFVTKSPLMWVLLLAIVALYAVCRYFGDPKKKAFRIERYGALIWRVVLTAAVLSVWLVVLLIILTSRQKLPDFLSGLYDVEFMNFNEAWGNHRGFNWRMAFEALKRADLKDMLIGTGPDTFDGAMDTYCALEVQEYWRGTQLACAHNEWLNMLVTGGILGLAAYFGIFASAFRQGAGLAEKEPAVIPFMAMVAAYVGHNVFCYQQCVCTPVVFIGMGIIEMMRRSGQKE